MTLAVVYLAARDIGPFQVIEGETLDWRFRLRGPQPVSPDIAIVAIDDRSLGELGRWPFSRAWLAAAVDAIAGDGATSIVFDLLLVGPEQQARAPPESGAAASGNPSDAAGSDADRLLAEAIGRAGNVAVPFAFVYGPDEANVSDLPDVVERAAYPVVRASGVGLARRAGNPGGALVPLERFLAAGRPAHATVFVNADGSLRLTHPAIRYGESYYPSLPVEGVRQFLGIERQDLTLDLGKALSLGNRSFPMGPDMALAINYAGPRGVFETWSFIDVAKGGFPPGTFRGRLVLVGSDAAGLSDRFETPYSPALPGVEVFANIVDNFLGRGFLRRSPQTTLIDLMAIGIAGLMAASLGLLRRPVAAMLATAAFLGLWSAVAVYSFIAWKTWLNFLFPALALLLGATIVIAALAARESRRRSYAEARSTSLARYVSPLAMSDLQARESRSEIELAQDAAVMFADLVGFTHASEMLPPAAAARLLRRFHGCVEEAALAEGGIVDKFVGDAALVVFGVPQRGASDAVSATACARRLVRALAEWQRESGGAGLPELTCGVGIHYGAVSIAEVGGRTHAQITVTGDTVNVASRLQALTRDWSTQVIVSDAVVHAVRAAGALEMLDGFAELPVQKVRGRDRRIRLWAWPAPGNG